MNDDDAPHIHIRVPAGRVRRQLMNVCIYRIPAGESIVTGPSHCMTCGRRLKWYE
jgi:leader peptidase (prepilin peptidase)/N-methyltransferase